VHELSLLFVRKSVKICPLMDFKCVNYGKWILIVFKILNLPLKYDGTA
jgi:hypothetical protein